MIEHNINCDPALSSRYMGLVHIGEVLLSPAGSHQMYAQTQVLLVAALIIPSTTCVIRRLVSKSQTTMVYANQTHSSVIDHQMHGHLLVRSESTQFRARSYLRSSVGIIKSWVLLQDLVVGTNLAKNRVQAGDGGERANFCPRGEDVIACVDSEGLTG